MKLSMLRSKLSEAIAKKNCALCFILWCCAAMLALCPGFATGLSSVVKQPVLTKANALRKWLQDTHGAFISPKVSVEEIPGMGFGLTAVDMIKDHEEIVAIPKECCFYGVGSDAIFDIISKLITEKQLGSASKFAVYMDTLPQDVSFLPCQWSDRKLQRLEGTSLVHDAAAMKQTWETEFNSFVQCHQSAACLLDTPTESRDDELFSLFVWARGIVQSRGFNFGMDAQQSGKNRNFLSDDELQTVVSDSPNSVMTACKTPGAGTSIQPQDSATVVFPFLDFANHHDSNHCEVEIGNGISQPSTSVVLRTHRKHYPGEQIFISYGELSFQQKALSFGWVDMAPSVYSKCITPIEIAACPAAMAELNQHIRTDGSDFVHPAIEIKTQISQHRHTAKTISKERNFSVVPVVGAKTAAGQLKRDLEKAINKLTNAYNIPFQAAAHIIQATLQFRLHVLEDLEKALFTEKENAIKPDKSTEDLDAEIQVAQMEADAVELILASLEEHHLAQ